MLTLTTHPGLAHTKGYTLYIDGQTRAKYKLIMPLEPQAKKG